MTEDRKLRLERALSALFRFQQEGGSEQEFLARHPDLRDLLEPMLAGEDPALSAEGLPALAPGQVVAGYRLVREVGRGGVGVVYEAWHQTLERRVALKVLMPRRMQSAAAVERFLREGRTLAMLDHPGVVRVLDLGCEQGLHWLAMEFVEGRSLDRWLEQRRAGAVHAPAAVDDARAPAGGARPGAGGGDPRGGRAGRLPHRVAPRDPGRAQCDPGDGTRAAPGRRLPPPHGPPERPGMRGPQSSWSVRSGRRSEPLRSCCRRSHSTTSRGIRPRCCA